MVEIKFEEQKENIFEQFEALGEPVLDEAMPIQDYCGYINPINDGQARVRGKKCAAEVTKNIIGDFEKNLVYCATRDGEHPDKMAHVSTFKLINGNIYMSYYANTANGNEDPKFQEARLAFCPKDNIADMTIAVVQKAGDKLCGKTIDAVYDTILLYKGGNELFVLWTASADGTYYRLYRIFNIETNTFGSIYVNRFRVNNSEYDFSTIGIKNALKENGIHYKWMFTDIGIMQKLTKRIENGVEYYYTGAYSGFYNCLVKSRDLITWEYVSRPDFPSFTLWENAVYVYNDKVYYFSRQEEECKQGFLTYYDLNTKKWAKPFLIRDCQSRSDFFEYENRLFLVHAPRDREGFGIVEVDTNCLENTKPLLVADMLESCFYPYTEVHNGEIYISYTVGRKHIRLSHFDLKPYLT